MVIKGETTVEIFRVKQGFFLVRIGTGEEGFNGLAQLLRKSK